MPQFYVMSNVLFWLRDESLEDVSELPAPDRFSPGPDTAAGPVPMSISYRNTTPDTTGGENPRGARYTPLGG